MVSTLTFLLLAFLSFPTARLCAQCLILAFLTGTGIDGVPVPILVGLVVGAMARRSSRPTRAGGGPTRIVPRLRGHGPAAGRGCAPWTWLHPPLRSRGVAPALARPRRAAMARSSHTAMVGGGPTGAMLRLRGHGSVAGRGHAPWTRLHPLPLSRGVALAPPRQRRAAMAGSSHTAMAGQTSRRTRSSFSPHR